MKKAIFLSAMGCLILVILLNQVIVKENVINLNLSYTAIKESDLSITEDIPQSSEITESIATIEISSPLYNETTIETVNSLQNTIEEPKLEIKPETSNTPVDPIIDELEIYKNNSESLGTTGRLFIPSVDLSVGLYQTDISENNSQTIVDNVDSAAYFLFKNQYVIADHNYQKFDRIGSVNIGEKAYIKKNDGQIIVYKLVDKFEGKNTEEDLVDLNDNSIFTGNDNLVMYTCYKVATSPNSIMVTIWELA